MRKKKLAATAVALSLAAITVFSVGGNYAYANTNADIAVKAEVSSESVVLPVSVASEAWVYSYGSREYGTWKTLNIVVNDTMYPLSKDVAVNVTFNNGDEIKIYSGDSYELWEGTISISGGEVTVKSQNNKYASSGHIGTTAWGCNLIYSDGALTLSKTKDYSGGGGVATAGTNVSYKYDLTAKEQDGTPIEGVSVVQGETPVGDFSWLRAYVRYGYIKRHSEWGNGNSFDVIEGENDEPWHFKSVVVTNQNGYANMYLPEECKYGDYEGEYPDVYVGGAAEAILSAKGSKMAYVSNGLVDVTIDGEYWTNMGALGLEAPFAPFGTYGTDLDGVLGDYYVSKKVSETSSDTVTLKDTAGNDIAVVTIGVKENADIHLMGKDGESYKVTGLEPVVDIKMADGVTDWTVSVTSDDNNNVYNTLHINAVKSSAVTPSTPNGLCCDENGVWNYYVNGSVDYNYTGLANNEYGWFYVKNGSVDWSYTGLANNEYGWFYVSNGVLDWSYTGLANNEYGWFYVSNGALDWGYTGLANNEYGWFYVKNGSVDWSYTGLANNEYGWFYVSNGVLDWGYTGLANNEYGWFYVSNGVLDWSYTGLANNEYGWFYVSNGVLDWSYTGLANNEYGWFYVSNGAVDWSYTGQADNIYGTWNVVNGQVVF